MTVILDFLKTIINQLFYCISTIRITDVLDIAIVAFLIYKAIQLFRETRAGTLVKGIIIVLVIYALSIWLELTVIRWLLVKIASVAIIAVVIVFQPELRRALERVGRSKIAKFARSSDYGDWDDVSESINVISRSASEMQSSKTGALIVIERSTPLGEVIDTGTKIDAESSVQLLCNVFYPKSPLHDGAVIMRDGRIYAAGCILPLTSNPDLSSQLGTRHRAGIGVTEISDAVVVIVSEETGNISVAVNGKIERGFSGSTLNEKLHSLIDENEDLQNKFSFKNLFYKLFNKGERKDEQ